MLVLQMSSTNVHATGLLIIIQQWSNICRISVPYYYYKTSYYSNDIFLLIEHVIHYVILCAIDLKQQTYLQRTTDVTGSGVYT